MTNISVLGIVNADGIVPIFEPDAPWHQWSMDEIYLGTADSTGKYVPKVKDYVVEPGTYMMYIVDHLDPVTLVPTLREIRPANMSFSFTETDVLFGVGPGTPSDTYRIYVDKSVTPFIMAVDNRLTIKGTMSDYCKIFKGPAIAGNDNVISKVYDGSGNYISQNVPLELVAIDSHINYSVKMVAVCHTTEDLKDGEIVTCVIYNAQGHVVSKRQLLVENSSFIRSINTSQKYVSGISLDSPFLAIGNDRLIEFPLNIPVGALNIMGNVHYSDGSTLKLPIDGSKFKLLGIDQYVSTIVGQEIDLVLSYGLATNEHAYAGISAGANRYITEPYSLKTVNPNNSYTVKLFGYPFWVNASVGYQIRWWLFNLDRNVYFEVTPYVSFSTNTGPFDPKGYGYLQRKSVSLNLQDVSGAFKPFIHTQLVDIVLKGIPNGSSDVWTVSHESVTSRPAYGAGVFATKVTSESIDIACGLTDYNAWLELVYGHTYPLVDRSSEIKAPTPTHFVIQHGMNIKEYPITDWNAELNVNEDWLANDSITIRFIRRVGNKDMQLSMAVMILVGGGTGGGGGVTPSNSPATGAVTVTGNLTVGSVLTANTSAVVDADGLGAFTYQWYRDINGIVGATSSTYTTVVADVGAQISCMIDFTDAKGNGESITSARVGPITAVPVVNSPPTGSLVITGSPTVGSTLTADASGVTDADGMGPLTYLWTNGFVVIGTNASTYTTTAADVGFAIGCAIRYTDGNGTTEIVATSTVPITP